MEKENKIEALKKFFDIDMKIKEMLTEMVPTEMDDFSNEERMKYIDRIYAEVVYAEERIVDALESLGLAYSLQSSVKISFNRIKQQFLIKDYGSLDLKRFYRDNFSDMNPQLIEKVKETCVGGTWKNSALEVGNLITSGKSINEILHVIHSHIVNNDEILRIMPLLASKRNEYLQPINLYGEENELARKLYEEFPCNIDSRWTEIVGMQNKILMMVRDRGHALTMDIDTTNEQDILVRYFVPKLCNLGMIRRLPGINSVGENGANGIFKTDAKTIAHEIAYFIGKVPMDKDMNYYGKEELKKVLIDVETNNLVRENLEQAPCFEEDDIEELAETRAITRISSIKNLLSKSIDKLLGKNAEREMGE